jgi:hypothetical protein
MFRVGMVLFQFLILVLRLESVLRVLAAVAEVELAVVGVEATAGDTACGFLVWVWVVPDNANAVFCNEEKIAGY